MTKSVFPGGLFGDSLKAISRYLFKRLKLYLHWLNSKNNGPVLLLKTILRHLNCFLLSVAMDDKDGLGLKLEKTLGQLFQVLMSCLQKSPQKIFMVSAPWQNFFDILFKAQQEHFLQGERNTSLFHTFQLYRNLYCRSFFKTPILLTLLFWLCYRNIQSVPSTQ